MKVAIVARAMRERIAELGVRVRAEDGVALAVEVLGQLGRARER